jgi:hypothetical protein
MMRTVEQPVIVVAIARASAMGAPVLGAEASFVQGLPDLGLATVAGPAKQTALSECPWPTRPV